MPEYRYWTTDILTGAVLGDLPMYRTSCDRLLSGIGNFNGSVKLATGIFRDQDLLTASDPGRVALYMERDGTIIWGGPLWTRKYNSSSRSIDISAQTWESYFEHVPILNHFIHQGTDQLVIFKDLIDKLQLQDGNNVNFDTTQIQASEVLVPRTILVPSYEYHFSSEIVSDLVTADHGFDYTIDVVPSGIQDSPSKIVRVGHPKMGLNTTPATFDYPGNLASYTWEENAMAGATQVAGTGAGSGSSVLRAEASCDDLISAGYPAWWVVKNNSSLGYQQEVSAYAAAIRDKYHMPIRTPSFNIKPDRIPEFTDWSGLGNRFNVYVEDPRFPDGNLIQSRMIGWKLTPASGESMESLEFILEGVDA